MRTSLLVALGLLLAMGQAAAQSGLSLESAASLTQPRRSVPLDSQVVARDKRARAAGAVTQAPLTAADLAEQTTFGANLFAGGFEGEREDGLNPEYVVAPGDRMTLRLWGAATFDGVVVVDHQGNVFIPEIGPVRVGGVRNGDLTTRIEQSLRKTFTTGVNVYTNLEGTTPVIVYVTGYVERPGTYAGLASDSILYYLSRAGGIDLARGSFRSIAIKRGGKVLREVDLYEFLLTGDIERTQFKDGDTIVVAPRRGTVAVGGAVRNAYIFELPGTEIAGAALIRLARPQAAASHVVLEGTRPEGPLSSYVPVAVLAKQSLKDGDTVTFEEDRYNKQIIVKVAGVNLGPSQFVVPRGATLLEVLDHISVNPDLADYAAVSIRRQSVARRQKAALDDSLIRLEQSVLGASSSTDEESRIRVQEANLISSFVQRARGIEPQGVLVVSDGGTTMDVPLESGDVIVIPERSRVVMVNGEVLVPQALIFNRGDSLFDYVSRAGGFTDRADPEQMLVVRTNREVIKGSSPDVQAGDEIIVLPKVPVKNLQLAATIAQIIFQIALSAATVAGL